jgi:hypothetical protein
MAVRGSPLILVSTNLNSVLSFRGLITSNAVSTLAIKANTSRFSPLNGVTNINASLTDMYSVMLALSGVTTSIFKLGYMGMDLSKYSLFQLPKTTRSGLARLDVFLLLLLLCP